ncbi:hypothetical protein BDY21DRAFT_289005 [Lineolata rhizophorae]|uniref:Uncharacterized protein n=1 Tax=Lineolata rhizophorae TaxID=578093 RepID=A0A6A6NVL6_9PEZI|nr:hypothetical protein BDY21DRAFT_289005 [Lineolata rhizophorae]
MAGLSTIPSGAPGPANEDNENVAPSQQPPVAARSRGTTTTSTPAAHAAGSRDSSPEPSFTPTRVRRSSTVVSAASAASDIAAAGSRRLRSASLRLVESDAPLGMWAATGAAASKAPGLGDIRRGSFAREGWSGEGQLGERERERRASGGEASAEAEGRRRWRRRTSSGETRSGDGQGSGWRARRLSGRSGSSAAADAPVQPSVTSGTPNADGYIPPPKLPWTSSTAIGLRAFWRWFLTPLGFAITVYGLNVVAWGGMLFLLLCNAAPAMCHPTCDDINSPRRIWIEIDSQILNALFCVTGFGLVPWRVRDWFWWGVYRVGLMGRSREKRMVGLRRLAGIHRGWFRLPGSDELGPGPTATPEIAGVPPPPPEAEDDRAALPIPASKAPDPPLTGVRAPPTAPWKMDFVVWCNMGNTFLQAVLSAFMWGFDRYERPSWSTGLFVCLACIAAGMGGIMMFVEGKKVKKIEGVPPNPEVVAKLAERAVDLEAQQAREKNEVVDGGKKRGLRARLAVVKSGESKVQ